MRGSMEAAAPLMGSGTHAGLSGGGVDAGNGRGGFATTIMAGGADVSMQRDTADAAASVLDVARFLSAMALRTELTSSLSPAMFACAAMVTARSWSGSALRVIRNEVYIRMSA